MLLISKINITFIFSQIENGNTGYLDWISERVSEVSEDLSKNINKVNLVEKKENVE